MKFTSRIVLKYYIGTIHAIEQKLCQGLSLTDEQNLWTGRAKMLESLEELERAVSEGLSPDELEALSESLSRIISNVLEVKTQSPGVLQ